MNFTIFFITLIGWLMCLLLNIQSFRASIPKEDKIDKDFIDTLMMYFAKYFEFVAISFLLVILTSIFLAVPGADYIIQYFTNGAMKGGTEIEIYIFSFLVGFFCETILNIIRRIKKPAMFDPSVLIAKKIEGDQNDRK